VFWIGRGAAVISRQMAAWLAMVAIYKEPIVDFDQVLKIGDDQVGIKVFDDTLTITPEGTYDWEGWRDNFEFTPTSHPVFGPCHHEFLSAAQAIYQVVKQMRAELASVIGKPKIAIQGHSRGAALADGVASLFAVDGIRVDMLSLFEAPHLGMQQYADWCKKQRDAGLIHLEISTVNLLDPVVLVPPPPWTDSHPTFQLGELPGGLDDVNPIAYHMGPVIYRGILRHFPVSAS